MPRAVLLLHRLPDGSEHFDWMIEPPGEARGALGLVTFRVDKWGGSRFTAERLSDHRREYLDYEGPVSGNRGEVRRVARGEVAWQVLDAHRASLTIAWLGESEPRQYSGAAAGQGWWEFTVTNASAS